MADDLGAFRSGFRGWLDEHLPKAWRDAPFTKAWPPGPDDPDEIARAEEWHRVLHDGRWLAPGWPVEHGGRGLDLEHRLVISEELAEARAPVPLGFQGVDILGPALLAFGRPDQQRSLLPRILSGEDLWCQGYSEPGAGSDLAAMTTRAVRDGDHFVVTGQKVWTSYGFRANRCFLLARTAFDGPRHRAISFLLLRMDVPGVEWRPIRQMTGDGDFGELFLDEVRVPATDIVGAEGEGWRVAMHSLGHERLLAGNIAPIRSRMNALVDMARSRALGRVARQRVARLEARTRVGAGVQAQALALAVRGDPRFPAWASMVKLLSTELRAEVADLAVDLLGADAITSGPGGDGTRLVAAGGPPALWAYEHLDARAGPIYAGTSEIQRTIIAESGLGLPR